MSSRFQQKRRYLVGILVLVLVISVGVNLYDHFILLPQTQATTNNMRVQAFNAWLGKMQTVKNMLKRAETNIDVEDAHEYTSLASEFEDILRLGIEHNKELYYSISTATFFLGRAISEIYFGNQTGGLSPPENLDSNILAMIENVTRNIENLETKIGRPLSHSGIEPTQQLRETGVLADVMNYLEQIWQVSNDIIDYYR